MLYWAVFGLGYFLGVFLTLALFGKKEKTVVGKNVIKPNYSVLNENTDPYTKFVQLTKINTFHTTGNPLKDKILLKLKNLLVREKVAVS